MKLTMTALVFVQALLTPSAARADGAPCGGVVISFPESLAPAFKQEVASFCAGAASLRDIDQGASVTLVPGSPVIVQVRLADGRRAERHVDAPSSLRHTLEGLLTRPPAPVEPPVVRTPSVKPPLVASPRPPSTGASVASAAPPVEPTRASSSQGPSPEVGAVLVGRLYGDQLYGGIGAEAWVDLEVSDWLFGLDVRWDPYMTTDAIPGFHMTSVGGGTWMGRRLARVDRWALDLALGVAIVDEIQAAPVEDATERGEPPAEEDRDEAAGASVDVRPAASFRAQWGGAGAKLSTMVGFELSPGRIAEPERLAVELPRLPAWGVMTGVGMSWGRR